MGTDDVKRLRNLEQENSRLKKILAERDLEIEVMKEITAKKWWACRLDWPRLVMRSSAGSAKEGPLRCFKLQDQV